MVRLTSLCGFLAISACAPVPPPPPDPVITKLTEMCQAGDTSACTAILQDRERQIAADQAYWASTSWGRKQEASTTTCTPDYSGGVKCVTQ